MRLFPMRKFPARRVFAAVAMMLPFDKAGRSRADPRSTTGTLAATTAPMPA